MEMDVDTALAFMETEINCDPLREQAMRAIKKEIERLRQENEELRREAWYEGQDE